MTVALYLIGGLLIGAVLTFLFTKKSKTDTSFYEREIEELKQTINRNDQEIKELNNTISRLNEEKGQLQGRINQSIEQFKKQNDELNQLKSENETLLKKSTEFEAQYKSAVEKLAEQKEEMEALNKKFQVEFENIANKILKQNTESFVEVNQKKINEILNPLKENITKFEEKVNTNFLEETKQRSELKEQLNSLKKLNENLSQEARSLTDALKGSNKTQGNWGELILERILEDSGLIKGEEYITQYTDKNSDNATIKPDVVVKLPDDKHVIIDAKVSLTAYEAYVSAETPEEQEKHLKAHINSVKAHIKGLSEKGYFSAQKINSPEFVLMFLPIEASFSAAIRAEQDLFQYAWDRKIILVSPTTLLATLRTIASVWKHERQTKNAIEIAKRAGQLYDKFVSFVEDLQKIDKYLTMAKNSYNSAFTKIDGHGGLISRTEKLKQMGAKATKELPPSLLDDELEN